MVFFTIKKDSKNLNPGFHGMNPCLISPLMTKFGLLQGFFLLENDFVFYPCLLIYGRKFGFGPACSMSAATM